MTLAEQFNLALEFMLLGMGVVFVFLTLLVVVVQWMGVFIQKIESGHSDTDALPLQATAGETPTRDETLTAVITAAVHQYRTEQS